MKALTMVRRAPRLTVALAVVTLSLLIAAVALAATPPIQTITPKSADDITNIDVLRQRIKNYYGCPLAVTGSQRDVEHAAEPGQQLREGAEVGRPRRWRMAREAVEAEQAPCPGDRPRRGRHNARELELRDLQQLGLQPDDERDVRHRPTLPGGSGDGGHGREGGGGGLCGLLHHGPAGEPGAGDVGESDVRRSRSGRRLLGADNAERLRGRPLHQAPVRRNQPAAGKACSTIHYKTATRAHIESLGYDIVANFGDQFSDLKGGHADKTFKMPNPNYFLP